MSGFPCVSSHICESLLFGRGQCFCTSRVCVCDQAGGEELGSSGISLARGPLGEINSHLENGFGSYTLDLFHEADFQSCSLS